MYKLNENEFYKVRPLFDQPQLQFVIDAVIAGNANGDIWVDDQSHPKTACMRDKGAVHYLVGRCDNLAFNTELAEVVADRAFCSYLLAYCTSDAWSSELSGIFAGRPFKQQERCFYELERLAIPDWRERIAPDFSIAPIDLQLLTSKKLAQLDGLIDEIEYMWPSIDAFLERAFGFVALRESNEIACRCTAEYINGDQLGIGIETMREYQCQSLATFTASAFAEHCLSNNLKAHWDCWADNTPSVRVAEKVGFSKILEYHIYQGQ